MQTPHDLFIHELLDIRIAEQFIIQMREQGHHGRFATRRYPDRGRRPARRYLYLLTGIRGETVTDVSQRLLAHHGGLRGLFRLDVAELVRVRGGSRGCPSGTPFVVTAQSQTSTTTS